MLFKKRQYNVRKVIFTLRRYDGSSVVVEITGKLIEKKFFFLKWYKVDVANPDRIVTEWGKCGFVKAGVRDFVNLDQFQTINYKTAPHIIEK